MRQTCDHTVIYECDNIVAIRNSRVRAIKHHFPSGGRENVLVAIVPLASDDLASVRLHTKAMRNTIAAIKRKTAALQ